MQLHMQRLFFGHAIQAKHQPVQQQQQQTCQQSSSVSLSAATPCCSERGLQELLPLQLLE
jgi:hypothetical protein